MSERCRSVDFKQQTNVLAADTLRTKRIAEIGPPVRRDFLAREKRPDDGEQPSAQAASLKRSIRSSSVSAQKPALGSSPVPGSFRGCHEANSRHADKADQRCGNNRHQNDAHSLSPKYDGLCRSGWIMRRRPCAKLARAGGAIRDAGSSASNTVFTKRSKGHCNASEHREFHGRFCRSSGGLLETHSRLARNCF